MKKILICAVMSMVLLSGCSFLPKTEGIVKVNNIVITKAEFDLFFDREVDSSFLKNFGGSANFDKSSNNVMYNIFKDKVVNELIVKSLIDSEIQKRNIKVTNEDLKNETKTIIDKVGSKEELNKMLKQRGVSNAQFNEDLKNQIKIKKLISTIAKVNVSDSDVEKFYTQNSEKFRHPEQVRASHILISADTLQLIQSIKAKNKNISTEDLNKQVEEKIAAQKTKAEAILAEVKANPDKFEQIAQKRSDDKVSGERGGELGFFSKGDMVPEFSNVAFSMKPNTISETLVKSPFGYHIIKVTDRAEAGVVPLAKVKGDIRFYLETQKQIEILKNLVDGLMKNATIEYIDEAYKPSVNNIKKAVNETEK